MGYFNGLLEKPFMTTERLRGPATGTLFACGLGMVMTLVGLWARPPLAIDETRCLSVA